MTNCCQTGLSRPSLARSAAMTAAAAPWPSPAMNLASTTSTGITRRRMKMITATPSSVGIMSRNRLRMYRHISRARPRLTGSFPRPGVGAREASRRDGPLLGEPHGVELVVQVVARRDLPAVDLARVRDDAVPLKRHDVMHLVVEEALLEIPDVLLPLLRILGPALFLVEVVEHL